MNRVLFVCSGNTCRSPMAEYYFNFLANKENVQAKAKSAGLYAAEGLSANENTKKVLKDNAIDISSFTSRNIEGVDLKEFDQIVCMTKIQALQIKNEKVKSAFDYIGKDIPDPFGQNITEYKNVYKMIKKLCNKLLSDYKD